MNLNKIYFFYNFKAFILLAISGISMFIYMFIKFQVLLTTSGISIIFYNFNIFLAKSSKLIFGITDNSEIVPHLAFLDVAQGRFENGPLHIVLFHPTYIIILALSGGMIFGILYFAIKYTRFHGISRTVARSQDFPELFTIIEKLCSEFKIDIPEVFFMESSIPNAFVYKHHNKPALVLTIPLIEILDNKELETALAHELAHIKNKDLDLRKYSLLLRFALFINPSIHLIEPYISRSREYLADETAARITNAPKKLALALLKIEEYTISYKNQKILPSVPPEVFFFGWGYCTPYIFSRSPSIEKRVKRLISINS